MDKLPPEILHKIFVQIGLQQRIVCLLVCRSWWRVLDRYSLFYDINIFDDKTRVIHSGDHHLISTFKNRFDKIINVLEKSPRHAAQVEELYLRPHFNIRKVFIVFPNARVIKLRPRFSPEDHSGKHIDIIPSSSKVEFLSDVGHCDLASQLLYSNLGGRLKALHLDFQDSALESHVINQLKNLPVLETLSLHFLNISLANLENIHKGIPSIQDFTLERAVIKEGSLPLNIIPANAITKFRYHRGGFDDSNMHIIFYQYMAKKYTNAMDIHYEENYIANNAKEIYLNGALDFFRVIRPQVGKFTLNCFPDGINPFEALDAGDSKIQELKIHCYKDERALQYFYRSNQFKHVEDLIIENSNLDSIHFLRNMPKLTKLRLRHFMHWHPPVPLVDCFAACSSSLKTLVIEIRNSEIGPFQESLDSLENLDISIDTITSDLGDIISSCFPNMVNLKLRGKVKGNVNITLKNPRFQKATYSVWRAYFGHHGNNGLSFKSPHQNETLYYHCHKYMISRVPYEYLKDLPMLSIISLTEKKLEHNRNIEIF